MPCNSTAAWATFALATFLGVANIASPFFPMLLVGLCSSAIGMLLGWLVRSQKLNGKVPVIGLFLLLVILYVKLKTLNGSFFRPVLILDIPVAVQGYGFYFKGFLTRNLHLFQAFFGSFWAGKGFFFIKDSDRMFAQLYSRI